MKRIGIIGFGNMGRAIAEQIKFDFKAVVFDKDKNKTDNLIGINVASNIVDLFNQAEAVILAVKPQDFDAILDEIKNYAKGKLIISIAAGKTTAHIEKRLSGPRVIRIMPNLPARVGKGMICLCRGKSASEDDLIFSQQLFKNLGTTMILDEGMMDAATAISGSGPGYLSYLCEGKTIEEIKRYAQEDFIPSLTASAEKLGFTPEQAQILAEVTTQGSIVFLEKTDLPVQELKNQVTSKGGTTEAALKVLEGGGSLDEASAAAVKRARELSRE